MCHGQWFHEVFRLRKTFQRYALDRPTDEYEHEHRAETGFACPCGTVITFDPHGMPVVELPRHPYSRDAP